MDGLSSIRYVDGRWRDQGAIQGLTKQIDYLAEDGGGNLWAAERYGTLVRLHSQQITRFDTSSGLPHLDHLSIYSLANGLVFNTALGHYRFDSTQQRFIPDSRYGGRASLVEDPHGNIWMGRYGTQKALDILLKHADGSYEADSVSLKRFDQIPEVSVILPQSDGVAWNGAGKVLFRYDYRRKVEHPEPYQAMVRRVAAGRDSAIYYRTKAEGAGETPALPYRSNSLQFDFAAPYFIQAEGTQFSHLLEGYGPTWSTWVNESRARYTNLAEGIYTFKVKARNINGTESAIAAYSFEILPPWYRTYYAYCGYLVLFAVVLFLGIRLNTRRLQAAKTSLEGIVRERTAEISEQKDLILEQNQQLRALLKEKEMLIREVHHRVKNNLAVVSSMLSLQTMQIEEEKYRNLFQDSQSRIRTVALIHEKLYRAQELGKIVLPEYIPDLAQRIFDSQRPDNARVELKVRVDDVTLEADPAIHCGLLINELVTNALTHAFPAGEGGRSAWRWSAWSLGN